MTRLIAAIGAFLTLLTIIVMGITVVYQQRIIDDQRAYIEMGCRGRYQGAE